MRKKIKEDIGLIDYFKDEIPSPSEIILKAIEINLVSPFDDLEYLKRNFSRMIEEIQKDAYRIYLSAEEQAGMNAIRQVLLRRISGSSSSNIIIEEVSGMFSEFNRFFLSLAQSRKPRAGSAFEIVLKTLFKKFDYPFVEQAVINGKPDFLMPSKIYYDINPMDCIIFTAKRTLRERWKQIVTEGTRGLGFFLATIDEEVSNAQLEEMKKNRIHLVVPENIKLRLYLKAHNVLTFEEFFQYHLDPAVTRWKSKKII